MIVQLGAMIALLVIVRVLQLGPARPLLGTSLVPELAVIGAFAVAHITIPKRWAAPRWMTTLAMSLAVLTAIVLVAAAHAWIVLLLAALQTLIIAVCAPERKLDTAARACIPVVVAWSLTSGLPADAPQFHWLALFVATTLVTAILLRSQQALRRHRLIEVAAALGAVAFFSWYAFRVDGLQLDLVPYHRAPWADPAALIRSGHWLLWDVPSQYGFLSELTVAVFPAASTYEALYRLCGLAVVGQATMLYIVIRALGTSVWNYACAVALAAIVMIGDLAYHYPFNGRLYPQIGLRFFWLDALLFVVFLSYVRPALRERLIPLGFLVWAIAIGWSFESAVWCTIVWLGYLLVLRRFSQLGWLIVIPLVWFVTLEAYYRVGLGHGPDWSSYIEFGKIYTSTPVLQSRADLTGPGWLILILCAAAATMYYHVSSRDKRDAAAAVVATAWLAIIAVSSYYAVESYHNRINAVMGTLSFAFGLLWVVYRKERLDAFASARVALGAWIPALAILVAYSASISPSLLSPPTFESDRFERPIGGELLALMDRAGVTSADAIVLPQSPSYTTFDNGLLLPFLPTGGSNEMFSSWLPVSANGSYGLWYLLPIDRQTEYLNRFLARRNGGGWLFVSGHHAECYLFNLPGVFMAAKRVESARYSGVKCVPRPST